VTATPANVCPLRCYEARGADRADVTNDELGQIANARDECRRTRIVG